jgi:hypothetical protein
MMGLIGLLVLCCCSFRSDQRSNWPKREFKNKNVDGIDGKRLVFSKPMRKLNHQVVSMDDTA